MSPDQAALKKKAQEDLQDIGELKNSVGFNRWFMGRVNKRIAELEKEILEAAPSKQEAVIHADRARRDALLELKSWLGADEKSARAELER